MTLQDLLSNSTLLQVVAGLNNLRDAAERSVRFSKERRINLSEAVIDTSPITNVLAKMYGSTEVNNLQASLRNSIPKIVRVNKRGKDSIEPILEELAKFHNDLPANPSKEEVIKWFEEHPIFAILGRQVKEYRSLSSYVCRIHDQIDREKRIKSCVDPYLKITMMRHLERHSQPYVHEPKKVLKNKLIEVERLSYRLIATLVELDNVYNVGN